MVWEPFALAVIMGLLVSAAIYFIVMWPQVEPLDPEDMPATVAAPVPDSSAAPVSENAASDAAADAAAVSSDA